MDSHHLASAFSYILAAFGIVASVEEFFAGLFLAVACGFIMFAYRKEEDQREIWFMFILAFVLSVLMAIIHPHIGFVKDLPLPFCMGFTGLMSRYLILSLNNVGSQIVERSDDVTDKAISKLAGDKRD